MVIRNKTLPPKITGGEFLSGTSAGGVHLKVTWRNLFWFSEDVQTGGDQISVLCSETFSLAQFVFWKNLEDGEPPQTGSLFAAVAIFRICVVFGWRRLIGPCGPLGFYRADVLCLW